MAYDYSELAGKIKAKYGTQAKFAPVVGLSQRSLSLKMNGKIGFNQNEIRKWCSLLGIDESDIPKYFFTLKVQQH